MGRHIHRAINRADAHRSRRTRSFGPTGHGTTREVSTGISLAPTGGPCICGYRTTYGHQGAHGAPLRNKYPGVSAPSPRGCIERRRVAAAARMSIETVV